MNNINAYLPLPSNEFFTNFQIIEEGICPQIDSTPPVNGTITTNDSHQYFGTNTLRCSYSPYTFRTIQSVEDFQDELITPGSNPGNNAPYYVELNQQALDESVVFLCSRLSLNCPNGESFCSPLVAEDEIGDFCRAQPPQVQDQAITAFCTQHNTQECECFRRETNPDYRIFRSELDTTTYPSECWYIPCYESSHPLRLSTDPNIETCPPGFETCGEINTIYEENKKVISDAASETIACLDGQAPAVGTIQLTQGINVQTNSYDSALISVYIFLSALVIILIVGFFLKFI